MRTIITITSLKRIQSLLIALALTLSIQLPQTIAQCPSEELISDLNMPLGTLLTNQGNLLVSESGTTDINSGRISIVDPVSGSRRTLLSGLPCAMNDVNEPAGSHGIVMRGRTLYVAIGAGDVGIAGPLPGTTIPNPDPISSPIFSSILAIDFNANVEKKTTGFHLTPVHHQALANGQKVTLSQGGGQRITIKLVADFPDYVSYPLPFFQDNVQLSNPFQMVLVANKLYVTDGGRNLTWKVDINSGSYSELATFTNIQNPLFPTFGGPFLESVPAGIEYDNGKLLVTLFRGFPFPPGTSTVQQVDPQTGENSVFISGLRTAVGIMLLKVNGGTDHLVLQHNSGNTILPPFTGPGLLLHFENPGDPPTLIADCLIRPTSMTLDKHTGKLYVSEYNGRIVTLNISNILSKSIASHEMGQTDYVPKGFSLEQNFPNPFKTSTMISWQSPSEGWQTLKIYDLKGKEVATLIEEYKPAGNYAVEFDASNLPEGVYIYSLSAGGYSISNKMTLIK